jgi:alkylhydroperoxidase family enzyme
MNTPATVVTPRIRPLTEGDLGEDARALLQLPLKGHARNDISPFLLTVVRHVGLYRHFAPFAGKLLVGGKLPARDRELAILRGAWLCTAAYEWGEHVRIASSVGMSAAEIEGIRQGSGHSRWNPHERAVLTATEELHADAKISQQTWQALAQQYDERQLIELPMLVGAYQMIAYVQNALQVPLPEGSAGLDA